MKVIFLDIDGVLNVCLHKRDEFGSLFHQQFMNNLKRVVDETNAKIVISSSWRHSGLKVMQEMWKKRNLAGEVIDVTANRPSNHKETMNLGFHERLERGFEIQDWLFKHPEVDRFVIIDDDDDMLESQMYTFVQTSDNWEHTDHIEGLGLTLECADKAIKILNK